ncbi:MAG: acylphosphatase [Hyphomicrobiales bacterium]|nr:acylphosphatase [Hyphomicrobiales bacterium]
MQDNECKTKAVHVRIEGRVQGVWYRGWTVGEASKRGLCGWVRNRSDGSVEALIAGPKNDVNEMLEACWKGPPAAKVTGVFPRPAEETAEAGFSALPTL